LESNSIPDPATKLRTVPETPHFPFFGLSGNASADVDREAREFLVHDVTSP